MHELTDTILHTLRRHGVPDVAVDFLAAVHDRLDPEGIAEGEHAVAGYVPDDAVGAAHLFVDLFHRLVVGLDAEAILTTATDDAGNTSAFSPVAIAGGGTDLLSDDVFKPT